MLGRNKNEPNVKVAEQLVSDGEALLKAKAHPDPYRVTHICMFCNDDISESYVVIASIYAWRNPVSAECSRAVRGTAINFCVCFNFPLRRCFFTSKLLTNPYAHH